MSEYNKETLFAAWLDGNLSPSQQAQFEKLCIEDEDFSQRVASFNAAEQIGQFNQELTPPDWDKTSFFGMTTRNRWYQWSGLNLASLTLSVTAILMVITGFNIDYADGRLSIGFGGGISDAQVNTLVQQKFDDYQRAQQAVLMRYLDAMETQQTNANAQLTQYLLTSNRQERREDFAELFQLINQQRFDDQVFFARQLNDLQQEISIRTGVQLDAVTPVSDIVIDE